jgi:uncharacterized protein (DUF1697 family)
MEGTPVMPPYIALLRAVNVGGNGKLPMTELKTICDRAGFAKAKTYIASGNVVFQSPKSESQVKKTLEAALESYAGKPVGVLVRTAAEMAAVAAANPFPDAPPSKTVAIFLDTTPPANTLDTIANQTTEQLRLGQREIYVYYPDGIGQSKLRISASKTGTARNINTISKLVELAGSL